MYDPKDFRLSPIMIYTTLPSPYLFETYNYLKLKGWNYIDEMNDIIIKAHVRPTKERVILDCIHIRILPEVKEIIGAYLSVIRYTINKDNKYGNKGYLMSD